MSIISRKLNSLHGRRATDTDGIMAIRGKKLIKKHIAIIAAVIVIITAFILLWWYCAFLPSWIEWKAFSTDYGEGFIKLKDRHLSIYDNENDEKPVWRSQDDMAIQSVIIKDIDRDGLEELIMLVWKHGSYGEHRPFWVKKNDIALKQHIFIYKYDKTREMRLRPIWMSSELEYEVLSLALGEGDTLIVTDRENRSRVWRWEGFGLKLLGDSKERDASLLCAGDNLIHLSLLDGSDDYSYLYEDIAERIKKADIAMINQETILVKDMGAVSDYPRFGTPISIGDAIIDAGFDFVCLANNHAYDKGMYGIDTTVSFLKEKGIKYAGVHAGNETAQKPEDAITWIDANGIRIAVLAFTDLLNGMALPDENPYAVETLKDENRVTDALDHARVRADAVVVYVHWGEEYETIPNKRQQYLAKLFSSHGADVIVGCHPHVIQQTQIIPKEESGHETIVYYSLGNFLSGQEREECRQRALAEFMIYKGK
ncbi:MAG: CapA family protein, partial [Lachnospiraceae bacterium]|nr:CapA family protein [Lachnospiraceae bacterium]